MLDRLSAIRSFGPKALIGLLAIVALSTAACGGTTTNTPGTTSTACPNTNTLTGAGPTFINPLFSK
jgi:phosphate transport system substrate-binding protein